MNNPQKTIAQRYFKKLDPDYKDTIFIANRASCYRYNKAWVDFDIEGTLYLLNSHSHPSLKLFVANRKMMRNFVMDVDTKTSIEYKNNFIILNDGSSNEFYGIWVESKRDANELFNLLDSYLK